MAPQARPMDLAALHIPELTKLAREIRRTGRTIVLRENGEDVAMLSPAKAKRRRTAKTPSDADIQAALDASWVGLVDPEQLKRELDEARSDDRPPVTL